MDIKEFIEAYKIGNATIKDNLIKQHIMRTYAPVSDKTGMLRSMAEGSVRVDENGVSYIDMLANKINYIYAILLLYTDLEPIKDQNGNNSYLETYDVVQESGLLNILCSHIGEREINELTFINEQVLDMWYARHNSTKAVIVEVINEIFNLLIDSLKDLSNENINKDTVKEIASAIKETLLTETK